MPPESSGAGVKVASMTDNPSQEIERLNERVNRLAQDKSFLQLVISLINKIMSAPGLDSITDTVLFGLLSIIGGTRLVLYYTIDGIIYCSDTSGQRKKLLSFDNESAEAVFSSGNPKELESDFTETQMLTNPFSKAYTWIYPLKAGYETVGVLTIENLHISMQAISSHLLTLFSYIGMALKNEIRGQSKLKKVSDELETVVFERRRAEHELRRSRDMLETMESERTTELKRANDSLRASHEAYECILNTSTAGFWQVDLAGRLENVNDCYCRVSGFSREELLSLRISDLEVNETAGDTAQRMKRLIESGSDFFETRHRRKDGSIWHVEVSCSFLKTGGGKVYAFLRDITWRKQSEEILAKAYGLLQTIINTVPMRIYWKDCDLRYLGANDAFARDAGFTCPEELVGMDDYQLAWNDRADQYRADDQRVIESGIPQLGYEEPLTRGEGEQIWIRTSKAPLKDKENTTIGVLGVYEVITVENQTSEVLNEADVQSLSARIPEALAGG